MKQMWKRIWKIVVGIGVIVGLIVGAIVLWNECGPSPNHNPDITYFWLSATQVRPNGEIEVEASAYDDDGDQLDYIWEASGGARIVSISEEEPNRAIYTAPPQAGNYLITLWVKDTNGGQAEDKRFVEVKIKAPEVVEAESKAFEAYKAKDWARAIDLFSVSLEKDPTLYAPLLFRGNAYLENGQYSLALKDFSDALVRLPQNDSVYLLSAKAYLLSDEPQKSISDVDQFLFTSGNMTAISLLDDFAGLSEDEQLLRLDYAIGSMPGLLFVVSPYEGGL